MQSSGSGAQGLGLSSGYRTLGLRLKNELLSSNVVGFRGGWVLCLNLKSNCTIKLLDPELLNPKP